MTCTLATIAACLSLSNVYVSTGVGFQDSGVEQFGYVTTEHVSHSPFGAHRQTETRHGYSHEAINPYGSLAIGIRIEFSPEFLATIEGRHDSSLASNDDRGVNSVRFQLFWFPWGAR
jgi:hypothetical protein